MTIKRTLMVRESVMITIATGSCRLMSEIPPVHPVMAQPVYFNTLKRKSTSLKFDSICNRFAKFHLNLYIAPA